MCAQYSGRKKSENEIVVHFRLKVDFIGAKRNYSGLIEYIIISVRSRRSKNESHSRRAAPLYGASHREHSWFYGIANVE